MPLILLSIVCYLLSVLVNPVFSATPASPNTIKLGSFTPPPTRTRTPSPAFHSPTPPNPNNPNLPNDPIPPLNPNVFFSQYDPRWRNYPNATNNLGDCGCGETVSAMILSRFIDNSGKYTPPKMWDYYNRYDSNRCGTSFTQHAATMQAHGFKSSIHVYSSNQVLSNYLAAGYIIIIHYKVPTRAYGHYVLIDSVNGNNIKVYDPAYLPGTVQPMALETGAIIIDYITIKK